MTSKRKINDFDEQDVLARICNEELGRTTTIITAPRNVLGEDGPVTTKISEDEVVVIFATEFVEENLHDASVENVDGFKDDTQQRLGLEMIIGKAVAAAHRSFEDSHNSTRIMFAGDIHGNLNHARWLFRTGVDNDVNVIFACGDFGFWPHTQSGEKFLNAVERLARESGIQLYWVDGNHENHDIIDELVAEHGSQNPISVISDWIKYVPRGCRFTIEATTFMGYGGAYSVDWERRVLGESYWEQELIDATKIEEISNEIVDILVTHEAPKGKEISYKDQIPVSVHQRELVLEIQNKVKPQLHICGHHHIRENWQSGTTDVHVLGRDTMEEDSVLIIDI